MQQKPTDWLSIWPALTQRWMRSQIFYGPSCTLSPGCILYTTTEGLLWFLLFCSWYLFAILIIFQIYYSFVIHFSMLSLLHVFPPSKTTTLIQNDFEVFIWSILSLCQSVGAFLSSKALIGPIWDVLVGFPKIKVNFYFQRTHTNVPQTQRGHKTNLKKDDDLI